jgi:peroxiredoxin
MIRLLISAASCALGFAAAAPAADLKLWKGGPTPALELRDLEGRLHRLADYQGRVVLVNFWATWCAPCRDEMPSIQRLKDRLAGKPFAVLAVNLDEPVERVRRFLSTMRLDFTILLDTDKSAARAWGARILPASYVIGTDGRIRYTLVGELDWGHDLVVSRIAELLP